MNRCSQPLWLHRSSRFRPFEGSGTLVLRRRLLLDRPKPRRAQAASVHLTNAHGDLVPLHGKKQAAASERSAERRELDESAQRLKLMVPDLQSLRIQVEEHRGLGTTTHVRHVVIERAAARFVITCGDLACDSLGHDITGEVMRALRARSSTFASEDACSGMIGHASCRRSIQYRLIAVYKTA
jgi:hypothetical protein